MRRSQKTKRVSWASDLSLCQERLFLSDKSPSHVLGTDHLEENASADDEPEESFPPGFGEIQPANLWRVKLSQIPLIKWRSPRRFDVNNKWQVVAGEESVEAKAQSQREMSVLEAIYPQPSSIPPNPLGLLNVEVSTANDRSTPPVVPITPIEEEHAVSLDPPPNSLTPISNAAFTSIASSNGQVNLVDRDLLIKILNNHQNGKSVMIQNKPFKGTQYIPPNLRPPTHNAHMIKDTPNKHFYPAATQIRPLTYPPMKKDINYFKSLIQQHGRESKDGYLTSSEQSLNPVGFRDLNQRILKPCIYYNSPRGCRKGVNCTYQHDMSSRNGVHGFPGVHNAKRMKLDCEITGR